MKQVADWLKPFEYLWEARFKSTRYTICQILKLKRNENYPKKSNDCMDAICDELGMIINDFPRMNWNVQFSASAAGTKVVVEIPFSSEADLLKIAALVYHGTR